MRAWAVVAIIVALGSRAHAEDPARAKALFLEGRALIEGADKLGDPAARAAKLDAACAKFAASLTLDPQLGTQLNLGDCRARQGKLVEAYAIFEAAADTAARTHDRAAFVQKQLGALAGKLVRVTLHVSEPERTGLVVELAGREVPRDGWQHERVAEPGTIVVRASAPGRIAITIRREAAAGTTLSIDVPGLDPEHAATTSAPEPTPPPPPRAVVAEPAPAPIVAAKIEPPPSTTIPWIVTSAGGLTLVASLGIAIDAKLRYNDALNPLDVARANSAVHQSDIATGVGIAGAVVTGLGIYLVVRAHSHAAVQITSTTDTVGLAAVGRF